MSSLPEGTVQRGLSRGDHRGAIGDPFGKEVVVPYGHSSPVDSPMDIRPLWTGEVLRGQALAALDADERLARFVFTRAGLDLLEGEPQAWTLGSATLETMVERSTHGHWRALVAGHEAPAPLAVVYASAVSGEFHWLSAGTFPRWKRRALLDAGLVGVPDVRLVGLPDEASDATRELWTAIELLVRVRVLGGETARDPLPLSRPFLCHWTPLSERSTRTGMESLECWELIRRDRPHMKSGGRRALMLWTVQIADDS